MTRLEVFVRCTDGTGRTVAEERDDAAGRKAVDRIAFEYISRATVSRVEVDRSERTGGYGGNR